MLSLLLAFTLFLFFTLVGRAMMILVRFPFPILRGWLVAPAVGLSTIVLAVCFLNQAGFPVESFGIWLTFAFLALVVTAFWKCKSLFPGRQIWPFFAAAAFALLYTGWPALSFGFNWISYGNDDMANYCLRGFRFLHNGFYRVPTVPELIGGDLSQTFWFMDVPGSSRPGSDLLLAWISSITSLRTVNVFMPAILSFGLVQLFALAGLVLNNSRNRRVSLLSMVLLALSPLFSLGVLYQLIAQVDGIAVLLALCALLIAPHRWPDFRYLARYCCITAILISGLAILYPEVTPFVVLSVLFYWGCSCIRMRRLEWGYVVCVSLAVFLSLVLLRYNAATCIRTVLVQFLNNVTSAAAVADKSPFPYYLVPSGIANLFGFQAIAYPPAEPWMTITVIAGAVGLVAVFFSGLWQFIKNQAFAYLLLIMLGLGVQLGLIRDGFGLFKLSMFVQPLLAATIAASFARLSKLLMVAGAGIFLLATIGARDVYETASLGDGGMGFSEMPLASQLGLQQFSITKGKKIVCDSYNLVACKLAASCVPGADLLTPMRYWEATIDDFVVPKDNLPFLPEVKGLDDSARLLRILKKDIVKQEKIFGTRFQILQSGTGREDISFLMSSPPDLSLYNKTHAIFPPLEGESGYYRLFDYAKAKNWLILIHSTKGNTYYGAEDQDRISVCHQEPDFYRNSKFFSGLGRFMLLRVENPDQLVRLRISITDTVKGKGRTLLPGDAMVLGGESAPIGFVGNGAATVVTQPVKPVQLDGAYYLAVDFGRDGTALIYKREKMMKLYGNDISLDRRKIVAYGRDISALSEDEYKQLARPKKLEKFPEDLFGFPGLEFSGVYEDGWISDHSFLTLAAAKAGDVLIVRGVVPPMGSLAKHGNELVAWVNNQPAQHIKIPSGEFTVKLPIQAAGSETTLHLEFQRMATLPVGDDRPIAARIESISIKGGAAKPDAPM